MARNTSHVTRQDWMRPLLLAALISSGGCHGLDSSVPVAPPRKQIDYDRYPPHRADVRQYLTLADLRPEGANELLEQMVVTPGDPEVMARAALVYETSKAPVMTLVYGYTYAALDPDGPHSQEIAEAIVRVLQRASSVRFGAIHLALCEVEDPIILKSSVRFVPVAIHQAKAWQYALSRRSELTPGATPSVLLELMTRWKAAQPEPYDKYLELPAWLDALWRADHGFAFIEVMVGRAVSLHLQLDAVLDAKAYIGEHPFRPTHAVLPDDLVPLP